MNVYNSFTGTKTPNSMRSNVLGLPFTATTSSTTSIILEIGNIPIQIQIHLNLLSS